LVARVCCVQIVKMERSVLTALRFELHAITAVHSVDECLAGVRSTNTVFASMARVRPRTPAAVPIVRCG
jgi:hypothetical protein